MREPEVSVLIASDRVESLLPRCLRSLSDQAGAPPFEVVVASSKPLEPMVGDLLRVRWIEEPDRNPSRRRNRAAQEARGKILAFLDDDAVAEPTWLAAGMRALENAEIIGGPDLGPAKAPYGERLSDLLLSTPWIGSGVPAHERQPRGGPVQSPHDVALCNLFVRREAFDRLKGFDESFGYIGEDTDFVRRALQAGLRVELAPSVRVRHQRRRFPGAYLAQRWRYRVKTGRLLVEKPGLHSRGRVAAFLGMSLSLTLGVILFGMRVLVPALLAYTAMTWTLSFPIWRKDPILIPAVPVAFAMHHATYFAGLVVGMVRGAFNVARTPRGQPAEGARRSRTT